ncbi:hypothetical protein PVK06_048876 [Gossypium arboreum]|uniref:NADH:quinone oxidoreductase/Mrp antiporter transmembrane domain-containing protein n=1 Tax=Gossypium arboreum TaxID=29729 RepID=A0ABR0MHG0_GOSAR|nr:hypothetical protein PVK06_048876 [Gossypium arboreum]
MGGASSSILVHGFSWLYGLSGGEIELQEIVNGLINTQMYNSPGISIALIFITVGIGFKLSPAPSHQWTPDAKAENARCLLSEFKKLPLSKQNNNMVNQKSFLEQSLAKATQQLRKLREENRQNELKEVMFESLNGKGILQSLKRWI